MLTDDAPSQQTFLNFKYELKLLIMHITFVKNFNFLFLFCVMFVLESNVEYGVLITYNFSISFLNID